MVNVLSTMMVSIPELLHQHPSHTSRCCRMMKGQELL